MLLSQPQKRMCDDMNPTNILVTGICNIYVVFGETGLMLPLDLRADLLFFYHQKYQEPQNLLHMCVYSSLLRKATKEDRMRLNANLALTMHTTRGCHRAAPLMQGKQLSLCLVSQSVPASKT